jgi:hypothetical protein
MNYSIQIVEFKPSGYHGIMIMDNETGKLLDEQKLEEWIRLVGGYQAR